MAGRAFPASKAAEPPSAKPARERDSTMSIGILLGTSGGTFSTGTSVPTGPNGLSTFAAYPEPAGFRATRVRPDAAFFSEALGEFILPYDAVRTSAHPDQTLLEFLQSTYEAAATSADSSPVPLAPPARRLPFRQTSITRRSGP